MVADALAKLGSFPWRANDQVASEPHVLHFHDVPLIGVSDADQEALLFMCLSGVETPASAWALVEVPRAVADHLLSATYKDLVEVEDAAAEAFRQRTAVFVVAVDYRIRYWTPRFVDGDLFTTAREALRVIEELWIARDQRAYETLGETLQNA